MKQLKKLLLLLILIIIIFLTIKALKKEHKINYKINDYTIEEKFYLKNKKHWYDIVIKNKNNTITYSLNKNINKKKKIIKDIKTYKSKNLNCLIPIYKKTNETNIYCTLNKKQVSIDYLLKSKSKDFNKMLKKTKKYNLNIKTSSEQKTKYKKLTVYQKNINDNYKFIIWDYKGIYIIDNENIKYKKFLKHDLYDNVMATVVSNYYVLFENSSVNGIENIYYYNLEKDKLKILKLKEKISKDSYINGTDNNLIYVTDRNQKKQYKINIKKEAIEEVEENKYYKITNEKSKTLTKSDFFIKDQYFDNEIIKDKTIKEKNLKKEYNYFYYLNNNKMYSVLESTKKSPKLLFELNNIKEWNIKDRDIILINEDCLYLYTEDLGLSKIVEYNELNYNHKNIYKMWKK